MLDLFDKAYDDTQSYLTLYIDKTTQRCAHGLTICHEYVTLVPVVLDHIRRKTLRKWQRSTKWIWNPSSDSGHRVNKTLVRLDHRQPQYACPKQHEGSSTFTLDHRMN